MQDITWDSYNDQDTNGTLALPYDTYMAHDKCDYNYIESVLPSVWSTANYPRIKYLQKIDPCNQQAQ